MKEGDYFGESAFFSLTDRKSKNIRMGKASSNMDGAEVYAVGLIRVKEFLSQEMKSIIFFNQEKWALYRDPYLSSLNYLDINYLIQLFNVK